MQQVWCRARRGADEHCPSPERSEGAHLRGLRRALAAQRQDVERLARHQTGFEAHRTDRLRIQAAIGLLHCRIEVNSGFPAERGPFATGTS